MGGIRVGGAGEPSVQSETSNERPMARPSLVMLEGSNPDSVRPREDVRGLEVRDRNARTIGEVDDLVIDTLAARVRLLKVGNGGLLGIGREFRLVPVDVVERIDDGIIAIRPAAAHFHSAPRGAALERDEFILEVYRHFGCQPFWLEGYRVPEWTRHA